MSNQEYDDLWHYSERFTRDKLQRSELVTMAWKEGVKLGPRCNLKLMKSAMHFRARELDRRSAFPASDVGKKTTDVWNHERVYFDTPVGNGNTLADFFLSSKVTPLDQTITTMFVEDLTTGERTVLEDLSAGYTMKEISQRQALPTFRLQSLRQSLQHKAVAHLI